MNNLIGLLLDRPRLLATGILRLDNVGTVMKLVSTRRLRWIDDEWQRSLWSRLRLARNIEIVRGNDSDFPKYAGVNSPYAGPAPGDQYAVTGIERLVHLRQVARQGESSDN